VFIRVHPWLKFIVFAILHEDADLLVVNKPAGLVCHPTKNGEMSSLIGRARLHLNNRSSRCESAHSLNLEKSQSELTFAAAPHLVNRLDRETSGVVLIAKNSETARALGKIIESRAVEKEYLAIVHGHVREDHGLIDEPLGKDEHSRVVVKDCVRPGGAAAQTEFFVELRFVRPSTLNSQPSTFSLLRVIPRTGRKHQIRIHLAHLGHPIVGDKLYGGDDDLYLALVENRLTDAQRAKLIFENHALHARAIKFFWRGGPMEFSCEPEPWFKDFIATESQSHRENK
jgi:23S rRNA pseudouridine1911/1915/1917 synthase